MTDGAPALDSAPEGMDARLRAVEQAVVRIQATLDSEFPRLRAEIGQLESGVDGKLASLESRIDGKLAALESSMDGKLAALESRMDGKLAAFESRVDARFDAFDLSFEKRMAVLETRIVDKQVSTMRWLLGIVAAALIAVAVA